MIANLFWAIFGPPTDDQETLELVGSSGRVLLNRATGMIDAVTDFGRKRETIDARGNDFESSHYGADLQLVRTLRRFVDGAAPPAGSDDGVTSLRMIEATRASLRANGHPYSIATQSVVAP